MISPEDMPTVQANPALTVTLGHTSLGGNTSPPVSLDIRVDAAEPAVYAPAGARPYLGKAERGPKIEDAPGEAEVAIAYAQTVFPGSTFSFLGSGRHGVVLADDAGRAFKVYRSATDHYSRYEREAGALKLLSDAGLAPRVHLFVDAGRQYRLDSETRDYTNFGFEDVPIPRQNSGKQLPILVMDRVDTEPLERAEPDKFADGFCKVVDTFSRHNIQLSPDAPTMLVDKKSGEVIMLDVGELSQRPFEPAATPQARQQRELQIVRDVTAYFGLFSSQHEIQAAYQQGGLGAVRGLLARIKQNS